MIKDSNITIAKTYKDLLSIIRHSIEQYNEIRLVDLKIAFDVNTLMLVGKKGIPMDPSTNTIFVNYPVIIDGLECDNVIIDRLSFKEKVYFISNTKSIFGNLAFYDCFFDSSVEKSLEITDITCDEFNMTSCNSKSSITFDRIDCRHGFNIDNATIEGCLDFKNIQVLRNNDAEFYINGQVAQDVCFNNCQIFDTITVNVDTGGSVKFEFINYDTKEIVDNSFNILRQGTLSMNGITINKRLVFLSCNIGTIDLANVTVDSISEFELRYKRLKNQAATILRNSAFKRNDDVAYSKYTADIYDDCLRSISVNKLRRWIKHIDDNQDFSKLKKVECKYNLKKTWRKLTEPFLLLITNLFSAEGILLWLNKYSNDYNRSWFRGIVFTCIVALISYFTLNYLGMQQQFFVIDWHFNGFGSVFDGYLSLLDIFNIISEKPNFHLTSVGKAIMFISKILIAYGEWQTIYAFYKYKK